MIVSEDKGISSLEKKTPIYIQQVLMFEENIDIAVGETVKAFPMRDLGHSLLHAIFVKSGVYLNEILHVLLTVNNLKCSSEVSSLNVSLIEEVNVTSPELMLDKPLTQSKVIKNWNLPLVSPAYASTQQDIQLSLKDLPRTVDSINGKRIKRFYKIEIFPTYNIYFANSVPMISFPIQISADLNNSLVQPVPPPSTDGF